MNVFNNKVCENVFLLYVIKQIGFLVQNFNICICKIENKFINMYDLYFNVYV